MLEGQEVCQELLAGVLRSFGEELGGKDMVLPDGCGEVDSMIALGGDCAVVERFSMQRMIEKEMVTGLQAGHQRTVRHPMDLIPALVR